MNCCVSDCLPSAARPEGPLTMVLLPRMEGLADDMWCTICKDHIGILDEDLYKEEVRRAVKEEGGGGGEGEGKVSCQVSS